MTELSTQITPINSGVALTTGPAVQIVVPNPSRRGVIIHNPNAVDMWIAPTGTTPVVHGAGSYQIVPGGDRVFLGDQRATCGWSAIVASGGGFSSVLDFQ